MCVARTRRERRADVEPRHAGIEDDREATEFDLHKDLERLGGHFEVKVLVSLIEDHELGRYQIPELFEQVPAQGIELRRLPILDGGVLPEIGPVEKLVEEIGEHAAAGRNVLIHCAGGLGRTGTIGDAMGHPAKFLRRFESLG